MYVSEVRVIVEWRSVSLIVWDVAAGPVGELRRHVAEVPQGAGREVGGGSPPSA